MEKKYLLFWKKANTEKDEEEFLIVAVLKEFYGSFVAVPVGMICPLSNHMKAIPMRIALVFSL